MALPTVAGSLGVAAPVFVRKLQRKTHWGTADQALEGRVAVAVQKLFLEDKHPRYSFYLVRSDDDLRRFAVALNAGRSRLTEIVDFVAFLPDELHAVGLAMEPTSGATPCRHANGLHHDLTAAEGQLAALCRRAIQSDRAAGRCTESVMGDVVKAAQAEQCYAALPASPGCKAPGCS